MTKSEPCYYYSLTNHLGPQAAEHTHAHAHTHARTHRERDLRYLFCLSALDEQFSYLGIPPSPRV